MKAAKDKLIIGRKPVMEALQEGHSLNKVFMANTIRGHFEKEIRKLSKLKEVPLQYVDPSKLKSITGGKNHQGIAAFISPVKFYKVDEVVSLAFEQGVQPLIIVLDGITDVRNFGAIARSAEVLGAHALLIGMKNAAPINEVAIKTSAGALLRIPVCRTDSLVSTLQELKSFGLLIAGAELSASLPVSQCDMTKPIALVLGAEEKGIGDHILDILDLRCNIPQTGKTDSLNVSVAAGILLYEISRQRKFF